MVNNPLFFSPVSALGFFAFEVSRLNSKGIFRSLLGYLGCIDACDCDPRRYRYVDFSKPPGELQQNHVS